MAAELHCERRDAASSPLAETRDQASARSGDEPEEVAQLRLTPKEEHLKAKSIVIFFPFLSPVT